MSTHVDLDGLADLLVGEGSDRHVDHLSGCATCSAALVALDDAQTPVRVALTGLPDPELPPGFHDRLDAALRSAGVPDAAPAPVVLPPVPGWLEPDEERSRPGARVVPLQPRRPRTPSPWLLRGAAAALGLGALVGGGALLAQGSGGTEDSATTAAAGGAGAEVATRAPSSTGLDYAAGPDRLAKALPVLLRGGVTSDRPGQLAPDMAKAVGEGPSSQGSSGMQPLGASPSTGGDPLARLREAEALRDCLSALPSGPRTPLALDYAAYAGRPALAAVLPTEDPERVELAVVGAGCSRQDPQLLSSTRLPRP